MARIVLLLRAVNLGPRNKVPMAELRELLEREGFDDVRTLLNSGNVVVRSTEPVAQARAHAERALGDHFGFEVPVMARTAAQIAKVAETAEGCDHVVFFNARPKPSAFAKAEEADLGNDRYELVGSELYIWLPDGVRGSKLLKALGRSADGGTMRTANTVRKLHQLASGA